MSSSAITTETSVDPGDIEPGTTRRGPIHPGEMLWLEFMEPMGLTAYGLAKAIGVPRTRIERLLRKETSISADTALRVSRYLGIGPEMWLTLQARYDLFHARGKTSLDGIVPLEYPPLAAE